MNKNIFLSLSVLFLAACSSVTPPMNQQAISPNPQLQPTKNSHNKHNQTLLILTFSGGGTRAAALSYGVLKGLRNTNIKYRGKTHSLLSEVDLISSVSGGSFTAAYYGLFGDKIFSDYEKVFLKHNVQSDLINSSLSPRNWNKLGSDFFNRSDLAAEYYSNNIFENKNFSDIRHDSPVIVINATDISTGTPFSFTPRYMDLICSNLDSYPISRAITASSAVPGVFSPIALKNHDGCKNQQNNKTTVFQAHDAFNNKKRYPYLHLVDGGISDNLGIRPVLDIVTAENDNLAKVLKNYKLNNIKNVAIIVVNSADDIPPKIAKTASEPSIEDTIGAVTTLQSRRYNIDTIKLLNEKANIWKKQLNSRKCSSKRKKNCKPVNFHIVELNLKQLPKTLAEQTSLYKTSFELPEKQVDTLINAGQYLLQNSQPFLKLVKKLNQ
ncbi:MAG: patatin-like phospholipase family protein [Gammaproteobacteria bacterium]|nr:patatin-like phospholipase family protein [Gammaproteobacteria bacterium]